MDVETGNNNYRKGEINMEFMGYVRPDGKVGARNYVAVIPSVTCANDVAAAICHQVMGTGMLSASS